MAEEFLSPIDMLLDENNTENIKLYNEDNQEVEFEQIALVPIENKTYAILKPATVMEGIADDEALVFVIDEIDDEDCLVIVEDDKIIHEFEPGVLGETYYFEDLKGTVQLMVAGESANFSFYIDVY